MRKKTVRILLGWACWMAAGVSLAQGQALFAPLKEGMSQEQDARSAEVDVKADRLEYKTDRKTLMARGKVVVSQGGDVLRADMVDVDTQTREVHAKGNVVFESEGRRWEGQELRYNFLTRQGDFGAFKAFTDPFYITAQESKRIEGGQMVLQEVTISSCEGDDPEFYIKASRATFTDGHILRAHHAVVFLHGLPVFYFPYWKHDMNSTTRLDLVPGYSKRMGAFLLASYTFPITENLTGVTHLDYRTRRGVAVGQDVLWEADNQRDYAGGVQAYYLQDQNLFLDDEEEAQRKDLVEKDRYRLRLSDVRNLTERDYVITEVNYLSDPWVISDFFDRENRNSAQPENRINLAHRGDRYTAGLLVNKRLNDFYENVDRLPQAYLDFTRQQIAETPFYYEGNNSAARLEKVYPENSSREKYDAVRVDSAHQIFYPTRHFGFFNLIPDVGYRGTYYSRTVERETVTNTVPVTDTNGVVVGVTNQVENIVKEGGGELRNLFQLGFETSFKAFKVLSDDPTGLERDIGLRHVAEPYTKYTYIPEPNLRPADLPQFDGIDRLDRRNDIQLGLRNKLQTKREGRIHDLLYTDFYTYYRFQKDEGQNDFSDVIFDGRLRLVDWWLWDVKGGLDPYEGELSFFNTQMAFVGDDKSRLSVEYRHQRDTQDLVSGAIDLFPNSQWGFQAYARHNIKSSTLEEYSFGVEHRTSCTGKGLYFRQTDDEPEVWFQFWLTAFPSSMISLGR